LGVVVADVSYYTGNNCDNLINSLGSGCSYNRYLDMVALVTADAEEDEDQCLARRNEVWWLWRSHIEYQGKDAGWLLAGLLVLTGSSFNYIVSETIERRYREWKRHGNQQLQAL
jgi:hypothetical protein